MLKGPFGVTRGTVSTNQIIEVIIDLLEGKANRKKTLARIKQMDKLIREELELLECFEGFNGEERVVVSEPKEWYIHNSAKAETRGAILESLLEYLEKKD